MAKKSRKRQRKSKDITLPPIWPNAGLEAEYRKKLQKLIEEMNRSVVYWIKAAYYRTTSGISPAMRMRNEVHKLSRQWTRNFDDMADELSKHFAMKVADRVDGAVMASMKKAGFAVEFKMTAEQNNVLQATIGEQVGLIKSIPQQYLSQVEGSVMRSVAVGGDLKTLTDELQSRYKLTRKRAAFIAQDQNAKAFATLSRTRMQELGITQAKWLHSHGGKEPRKTHLKNDGELFDLDTGWFDPDPRVKKYILPGELPRCRCTSRAYIPSIEAIKLKKQQEANK
jgi:uncharacterized protein with gpF-like domain